MGAPYDEMNLQMLERVSHYLNRCPRFITREDAEEIASCGVSREEAARMLLGEALGIADSRAMMERYLRESFRILDARVITENPYVKAVTFPEVRAGGWTMTTLSYAPYEVFVRDDLLCLPDGREIPQLGCFDREVAYPAVLQDGREWMTVTPNEIATMEAAVRAARGHTVAMGLGLGYYAFMAGMKEEVSQVTVVERDAQVIALFTRYILPQFPHREKICIVQADAFDYVRRQLLQDRADYVFADLWHDVADGAPLYMGMKAAEAQLRAQHAIVPPFGYWIETSIRSFLDGLARDGN
ncbi:MAG: hypothetical protein J6K32_03040 [Clostridia bacterium]|nr:hypothetical protein [Clostridia bacterium]